jgi:reactive intermediate/imine deaminase
MGAMSMQSFADPRLPKPMGPYSPVVKVTGGSIAYVAGMTALDADGKLVGEGDVKAQARQVIENVKYALEAAGGTLANVARTTVYLADISSFADVNAVYAEYFAEPFPARVAVQVVLPRKDFLVEIDAVAVLP